MRASTVGIIMSCLIVGPLAAQGTRGAPAAPAAPPRVLTAEQQVAAAVLPLPDSMRPGARVFGYVEGRFTELKPGTGTMTCLISDPHARRFQVACYHNSMEAFMARGRELRAQGITNPEVVDSIRNADVAAGRIHLPAAASLYSLNGGSYDPATNTISGARPLYVVYIPFATEASTGITATPQPGKPWLMHPGLPGAHVMYAPQ